MASTIASPAPETVYSDTSEVSDIDSTATPSNSQSDHLSSTRSRKRLRKTTDAVWEHARDPILGVEPVRSGSKTGNRRIWYCKVIGCSQYSVISTSAARYHMKSIHKVDTQLTPSTAITSRQKDLRHIFSKQALQQKQNDDKDTIKSLQKAIDKAAIHQALLRLIVHHDLPLSMVHWPELHTLVFALNHQAGPLIWSSHTTTASHINQTFIERQQQVGAILRQSQSLIHLTTELIHGTHLITKSSKPSLRTSLTLQASSRRRYSRCQSSVKVTQVRQLLL